MVANSSQQPGAVLTVVGHGQMTFKKGKYELRVKGGRQPRHGHSDLQPGWVRDGDRDGQMTSPAAGLEAGEGTGLAGRDILPLATAASILARGWGGTLELPHRYASVVRPK